MHTAGLAIKYWYKNKHQSACSTCICGVILSIEEIFLHRLDRNNRHRLKRDERFKFYSPYIIQKYKKWEGHRERECPGSEREIKRLTEKKPTTGKGSPCSSFLVIFKGLCSL